MCGTEFAIGPGKTDLLEAIARTGSISASDPALRMSYRRAWLLVDTMNRRWAEPLVEAAPGGGQDKGSRLTAAGDAVLNAYRELEAKLTDAAQGWALKQWQAQVLPVPGPARQPGSDPAQGG